jgi:hypothetical protein
VLAGVLAPGGAGADHRHGLAIQRARPDQPVEGVLERAGERAGVLGGGDDDGVAARDPIDERRDRGVVASWVAGYTV